MVERKVSLKSMFVVSVSQMHDPCVAAFVHTMLTDVTSGIVFKKYEWQSRDEEDKGKPVDKYRCKGNAITTFVIGIYENIDPMVDGVKQLLDQMASIGYARLEMVIPGSFVWIDAREHKTFKDVYDAYYSDNKAFSLTYETKEDNQGRKITVMPDDYIEE